MIFNMGKIRKIIFTTLCPPWGKTEDMCKIELFHPTAQCQNRTKREPGTKCLGCTVRQYIMNYYPLFRVRSLNNSVHCMSFCFLMTSWHGNHFRLAGPLWGETIGSYVDSITRRQAVTGNLTLIARLIGPTWGPSGADRTQMVPLLAPWTLQSGEVSLILSWTNYLNVEPICRWFETKWRSCDVIVMM